mgnify:FL=1
MDVALPGDLDEVAGEALEEFVVFWGKKKKVFEFFFFV